MKIIAGLVIASSAAVAAAPASARIVPQESIKGIELGMSVSEVREAVGSPDRVIFRKDPIQGRVRVYKYGLTYASFAGDQRDAIVNAVSTRSRHERTRRGVGVGSRRSTVAAKVPGAKCQVEYGFDHCWVGRFTPGSRVTDFRIAKNGTVSMVVVGYVID